MPTDDFTADREKRRLTRVIEGLRSTDRDRLLPLVDRMADELRRQRRTLEWVRESLEHLQLDVSYLLFDLEATRRERDDLLGKD